MPMTPKSRRFITVNYEQVYKLTDTWESILAKYHVQWVIMPSDSDIITRLRQMDTWETFYRDETATVMVRR